MCLPKGESLRCLLSAAEVEDLVEDLTLFSSFHVKENTWLWVHAVFIHSSKQPRWYIHTCLLNHLTHKNMGGVFCSRRFDPDPHALLGATNWQRGLVMKENTQEVRHVCLNTWLSRGHPGLCLQLSPPSSPTLFFLSISHPHSWHFINCSVLFIVFDNISRSSISEERQEEIYLSSQSQPVGVSRYVCDQGWPCPQAFIEILTCLCVCWNVFVESAGDRSVKDLQKHDPEQMHAVDVTMLRSSPKWSSRGKAFSNAQAYPTDATPDASISS